MKARAAISIKTAGFDCTSIEENGLKMLIRIKILIMLMV
jgi:hypothetical protein